MLVSSPSFARPVKTREATGLYWKTNADYFFATQIQSSLVVGLAATLACAVTPLVLEGDSFVNSETGKKFQIVGVAYQPGGEAGYKPEQGEDALSNGEVCKRDAAIMQRLGINAIRTYNLSPDLNHDECASVFNAAGMYMMLDVNSPLSGESLHREEPWTTYTENYLNRTFAVVEAFKDYPNTLLFFSANEVIDQEGTATIVPPYLRAVQRDLRAYIKKHLDRPIPVGYSAADVRPVLYDTYQYLVCDNDDESALDLFALNSYSWCGEFANFENSTFEALVEMFDNSSVPVFFSEYGCNNPQPRFFNEIQSIYGSDMNDVFSGGVIYEYSQEKSNYGIVDIGDDGTVKFRDDFKVIQNQFLKIDFTEVQNQDPPSNVGERPKCSSSLITEEDFNSNFTIPEIVPMAKPILEDGVDPKPSGKIIDISDFSFSYSIQDADGNELDWVVQAVADSESNVGASDEGTDGTDSDDEEDEEDEEDAAVLMSPGAVAMALPALAAVMFAFA